jgi:hypothetical protein
MRRQFCKTEPVFHFLLDRYLDTCYSTMTAATASIKEGEQWMETVSSRAELAAQYASFEKSLSFSQTLRIYWRSIAWVLYGLAVVFGYGIDGVVASNLISIPIFREHYGEKFDTTGSVSYIISAT